MRKRIAEILAVWAVVRAAGYVHGRAGEGKGCPANLLSDHVDVVGSVALESAVVGPEVHRAADASDRALIDLPAYEWA
jgi:hypothetical protein